ncbi:MAG: hypothetical protein AAGB26_15060 [Planctomycetota bacterium]
MALGRRYLTDYGGYKSRKDFTQHQLMACLILRTCLKTTCRGVIEFLAVSCELRETMGLDKLPNYSTLKKFADKPGVSNDFNRANLQVFQACQNKPLIK